MPIPMLVRRLSLAILAGALSVSQAFAQSIPVYSVGDHIKAPDGGYDYASFDPVHRRLYLSRAGGVLALDVDTKAITGHLADGQHTHEVLPLNKGGQLLVTDGGSDTVHIIDALSGARLAEIGVGHKPDAALFEPVFGLAVVMNSKGGDLSLIDPSAKTVVGRIAIGGDLEFAAADGTGKVFVNIEDQNQIAVVDLKTRAVIARYRLNGCDGPTGMAYAAGAGVLISACANKVAKVIRASDGADLATLAIGAGPDAVLYDADRHLAFIPCGRDGVLEVIAVRGPADIAIVQTLKTGLGARVGALDPKTGAIYLPSLRYAAADGAAKPAPLPGTFELLVVTPVGAVQ